MVRQSIVSNPKNLGQQEYPHLIPEYPNGSGNTRINQVRSGQVPIAQRVWPSLNPQFHNSITKLG